MKTNEKLGLEARSYFFQIMTSLLPFLVQILEVPKIRRAVSTSCFESRNLLLNFVGLSLKRTEDG
jgi:hypothetical protein